MIRRIVYAALAATALMAGAARAEETVVWWDFLGGGDGARMKKLIEDFNTEHAGKIKIQGTTLDWGTPFYSKVQTSTAIGQGPDIMTYHASRLPLGVSQGVLSEITDADMKAIGLSADSFVKTTWDASHVDGKQYAVPFDTHPIVLYYNKDKLAAAGLIGSRWASGRPQRGRQFHGRAKETEGGRQQMGHLYSYRRRQLRLPDDLFVALPAGRADRPRRGLVPGDNQAKLAKSIDVIASWVKAGVNPPNTDYPTTVALFTSGDAPLMINGVWEVTTMSDRAAQHKLFNWGAIELPVFFNHPCTYEDSHTLAIPNNVGKPQSPEKHAAVLEVIKWLEAHALFWATAGHIPANKAVTESAEYKAMQPQATYAVAATHGVFDPRSKLAGVGSPMFEAAGNAFTPALNGETSAKDAAAEMVSTMNAAK